MQMFAPTCWSNGKVVAISAGDSPAAQPESRVEMSQKKDDTTAASWSTKDLLMICDNMHVYTAPDHMNT